MTRMRTVVFAMATLVTLVAACGSSSDGAGSTTTASSSNGSSSTTGRTTGRDGEGAGTDAPPVSIEGQVNDHGTATVTGEDIELELDDFYFGPTYVGAPAGKAITVELHNEGSASHTFTIESQGIDITLEPDAQATVQVTTPSDGGPLVFHCRFHDTQGMRGAFYAGT